MTETAIRPALDPGPVAEAIDVILDEVEAERLDRMSAYEQITAVLDAYGDAIEAAGGGPDGDPDMWNWSERVRFADIPDGSDPMDGQEYLDQFSDGLTPLWADPRPAAEDDDE